MDRAQLLTDVLASINPENPSDRQLVAHFFNTIDFTLIRGLEYGKKVNILSKIISGRLKKNTVDIKEYFKHEIGQAEHQTGNRTAPTSLVDLMRQPKTAQSIFNPAALERQAYLSLDSLVATINDGYYTWSVSTVGNQASTVFVSQPLVNITEVQMLPLVIPYAVCGPTVAVNLLEINAQAFQKSTGPKKYVFTFKAAPLNQEPWSPISLTELSSETTYRPTNVLAELTEISVGFYNPYALIKWPSCITTATITNVPQVRLTFDTAQELSVNDIIIVQHSLFDQSGYKITALGSNWADINTLVTLPNQSVTVQLCSKRFVINLIVSFMPGF
jgi:hypothetical protein